MYYISKDGINFDTLVDSETANSMVRNIAAGRAWGWANDCGTMIAVCDYVTILWAVKAS